MNKTKKMNKQEFQSKLDKFLKSTKLSQLEYLAYTEMYVQEKAEPMHTDPNRNGKMWKNWNLWTAKYFPEFVDDFLSILTSIERPVSKPKGNTATRIIPTASSKIAAGIQDDKGCDDCFETDNSVGGLKNTPKYTGMKIQRGEKKV